MSLFLYIAGIIFVGVVITMLIIFLREKYTEDDFSDQTLVVNFLPQSLHFLRRTLPSTNFRCPFHIVLVLRQ